MPVATRRAQPMCNGCGPRRIGACMRFRWDQSTILRSGCRSLTGQGKSGGWLLGELGYEPFQEWPTGCSWKLDGTYVVVEQTDATTATTHRRTDPGVNHIAFHAGTRENVDRIRALGGGCRLVRDVRVEVPARRRPGPLRGIPAQHGQL